MAHLGTSIYTPIEVNFRCKGGPHYPREAFNLVKIVAFRPNSVFAFMRADQSFHRVEPIEDAAVARNILAYYIRIKGLTFERPPVGHPAATGAAEQPAY